MRATWLVCRAPQPMDQPCWRLSSERQGVRTMQVYKVWQSLQLRVFLRAGLHSDSDGKKIGGTGGLVELQVGFCLLEMQRGNALDRPVSRVEIVCEGRALMVLQLYGGLIESCNR